MMRRASSKKKLQPTSDTSPTASTKENRRSSAAGGADADAALKNQSIATNETERLVKMAVAKEKSSSNRLFGRRRGSAGEVGGSSETPSRGVRRHHSSEMQEGSGAAAGASSANPADGVEYREVVVNGKKKMVRVKKKSAAEAAAAGGGDGHRKLVKVKVKQVVKKHTQQQQQQIQDSVPVKVEISQNHRLRQPRNTPARNNSSDNASGVWSKAARSLFSFQNEKRSKASSGGEEDEEDQEVDLVFRPEGEGGDEQQEDLTHIKSTHSKSSRGSRSHRTNKSAWKPPTQLNGEPGVDTKSKSSKKEPSQGSKNQQGGGAGGEAAPNQQIHPTHTKPRPSALKSEFFEKFANDPQGDFDLDGGPPVLEINTNMNMTRTKTKSVFQSESMIRRQFIQDQWLSGGSNYQAWESTDAQKLVDMASTATPATEYTTDGEGAGADGGEEGDEDDVSDISCEDLVPDMLLDVKALDELEQWEALCADRIGRFGARSALTAESFVNRGIAQMHANRLEDAADSLLSAVCFLEEVHGTIDHSNHKGGSSNPSHMHMAQAFFLLGKVYMQQEQYPMAESAVFKALNIRQQHLGKSHPDTVECWEQMGLSYVQRAAQAPEKSETQLYLQRQAMDILTQVLKLKRAIFGSLHESVAQTARIVAQLCATRNEAERSQRLYKQVVNVLSKLDKHATSIINPDFPDPRDLVQRDIRKQELVDIEAEMTKFGLKEEIVEI